MCNDSVCFRCSGDLPKGGPFPGLPHIELGFCTSICQALSLRDDVERLGAWSPEKGWMHGTLLVLNRMQHNRHPRNRSVNLESGEVV